MNESRPPKEIALPLRLCGDESDTYIEDARRRGVLTETCGLNEKAHRKWCEWIVKTANATIEETP